MVRQNRQASIESQTPSQHLLTTLPENIGAENYPEACKINRNVCGRKIRRMNSLQKKKFKIESIQHQYP
jgi:hypothetical protein